ncbi:MAG: hypothetical protein C5B50_20230 [Verrucomicrobia bacterium]|nr:MAG: hypothetical protein C5B50_20230 [Verrucomicrobiota bacterium]
MQIMEMTHKCLVPVTDFRAGHGWENGEDPQSRARWCCQQLEESRILYFEELPFEFSEDDRKFLISQRLGDSRLHKNISYRPKQDLLRGFASQDAATADRLHEVMRRYSQNVIRFLSQLLAPYSSDWAVDYASFRPEAEQSRNLPVRKRNDLLHVDAFPSRPTHGGRILRCFTNVNPTEGRVWNTTDAFPELARDHAEQAGLNQFATRSGPGVAGVFQSFGRALGLKIKTYSAYDRFMLHFHDYMKENSAFQQDCPKIKLEFPPGSTWICFTDSVPHAVLYGQHAVEQTLIIPMSALVTPEKSPLRILERQAGRALA